MSFPRIALGDVVDILSGFAFKSELFNDSEGMPLIRIRDVVRGYSDTLYSGTYTNQYVVQNGEIAIGMDGNFNAARWLGGPALLNQRVCKITAKPDKLDDGYLFHFLPSVLRKIEDATPFVTVKHLSAADLKTENIPLPPLEEQRRIAAILDQAHALRAKRRESLAQLDSLTQSVFIEMFGNPVTNPKNWHRCSVGEVTDCIVPGRDKPKSFSGETPWITTENLVHLNFTNRSPKCLGLTQNEIGEVRARVIPAGSVVLSCVGNLGITTIAAVDMVINQQLHSFQCHEQQVNNLYLMYCLAAQTAFMYAKASSTTLPYMNKSVCNSIPVQIPPIELQKLFAARVVAIQATKKMHADFLMELDTLFASLQNRAFRGEL